LLVVTLTLAVAVDFESLVLILNWSLALILN